MQAGWRLISKVASLWLAVFAVTAPLHAEEGALSRGDIAQIQKAQSSLLQREFAGLAAPHKGETEMYTLAIAGGADQNVFIKELDGGLAAIASVVPMKGTVRLINHRKTVNTVPLANFQNFRQAVHAIGSIMDTDNDVLILLMTSHGDRTGFALQLPDSITELTPRQIAVNCASGTRTARTGRDPARCTQTESRCAKPPICKSAAPPTGTASGTRMATRPHKKMYMSAKSGDDKLKTGQQLPKYATKAAVSSSPGEVRGFFLSTPC